MLKLTPAEQEFAKLSFDIIEWKIAYYRPDLVHPSRIEQLSIPDGDFDKATHRYMVLCRELGRANTLVHDASSHEFSDVPDCSMMEIDVTRPSVQRALFKLARTPAQLRKMYK